MNWFRRLPGFPVSDRSREVRFLRLLPRITLWGSAVPLALLAGAHLASWGELDGAAYARLTLVDISMAAVLILHWTVMFTLALAAVIVWICKGPAYVADAYPLADRETPAPAGPGGQGGQGGRDLK